MSPYLALLADVQTPQIPSMPWTEMAAFFAVVAILGGVMGSTSTRPRCRFCDRWRGEFFMPASAHPKSCV